MGELTSEVKQAETDFKHELSKIYSENIDHISKPIESLKTKKEILNARVNYYI